MEHTAHTPASRHVRTILPPEVAHQLDLLKADLRHTGGAISLSDLLADAIVLLLRHHGRGDGLTEPSASVIPSPNATPTTTSI